MRTINFFFKLAEKIGYSIHRIIAFKELWASGLKIGDRMNDPDDPGGQWRDFDFRLESIIVFNNGFNFLKRARLICKKTGAVREVGVGTARTLKKDCEK